MKRVFEIISQADKIWSYDDTAILFTVKVLAFIAGCHVAGRGTTVEEIAQFLGECRSCLDKRDGILPRLAFCGIITYNGNEVRLNETGGGVQ